MSEKKFGILLANLGTPDAPTTAAVRRYLAEFLSDPRVIDVPRLIWKPILHGAILPYRSSKVAKLYQSIWQEEGSPLLVYSLRQKEKLSELFPDIPIEIGMSYGSPSVKSAIDSLHSQNVTDLVVLPLYPQYSCTTTAAVYDAMTRAFKSMRTIPSVQFVRSYATHPAYINALVASIEESFAEHGVPDRLILSFHGIPKRYCDTGDIYQQECEKTAQALREALNYPSDKVMLTYQSRFGREPWLTPYMDKIMHELPAQGVKSVQVICPGFSVDCLETLEEISEQNKEFFMSSGGSKYNYIPALNDSHNSIQMLKLIIEDALNN